MKESWVFKDVSNEPRPWEMMYSQFKLGINVSLQLQLERLTTNMVLQVDARLLGQVEVGLMKFTK